jgi:hypothetical protein
MKKYEEWTNSSTFSSFRHYLEESSQQHSPLSKGKEPPVAIIRKIMTLPMLELRPLDHLTRSKPLYRLRYPPESRSGIFKHLYGP